MLWRTQNRYSSIYVNALHFRTDVIGFWVTECLISGHGTENATKARGGANPSLTNHFKGAYLTLNHMGHRLDLPVNGNQPANLT